MNDPLTLRLMRKDEVDWLFGVAADEVWNPGLHDADVYWSADPEAFVAAEVAGDLVGGGAILAHGRAFGSLGHVVLRPDGPDPGLEPRLWRACLQLLRGRLGEGGTVGLDGVSRERARYDAAGFRFSHRTIRCEAVGLAGIAGPGTVPARTVPFERLAGFDRRCFPVPREHLLRAWLDAPDSLALAVADGASVRGYGIVRRCRVGARVEPLLADDVATAEALLDDLLTFAPDEPVFIDVPETNAWAMSLVRRRRMHEVASRGRLYLGPTPRVAESRIFGETAFELG